MWVVRRLKGMGACDTAVFKTVLVLVVFSKLSWVCTFENVMSGGECLIYQSGPSYDELKMCFTGV